MHVPGETRAGREADHEDTGSGAVAGRVGLQRPDEGRRGDDAAERGANLEGDDGLDGREDAQQRRDQCDVDVEFGRAGQNDDLCSRAVPGDCSGQGGCLSD